MKLKLTSKPKPNCTIIEGFPGFGFVSTIATEFLIDHLKTKQIGSIFSDELSPIAIIHEGEVKDPISIHYNEKHNVVIIEAVTSIAGLEWELSEAITEIYTKFKAKELISVEGIQSPVPSEEINAYAYTSDKKNQAKLKKAGIKKLDNGIILGISGALMVKTNHSLNTTYIFAETISNLPDSKAAAKIIESLDKYLGLKVDYKPLLKKAAQFEEKLKELVKKTQTASKEKTKREAVPYVS
jgi:uncharacterized protein (TIGR00161 family)